MVAVQVVCFSWRSDRKGFITDWGANSGALTMPPLRVMKILSIRPHTEKAERLKMSFKRTSRKYCVWVLICQSLFAFSNLVMWTKISILVLCYLLFESMASRTAWITLKYKFIWKQNFRPWLKKEYWGHLLNAKTLSKSRNENYYLMCTTQVESRAENLIVDCTCIGGHIK